MFKYLLVLALILPSPAFADAIDFTCPDNTGTEQAVARVPHGWLSSTLTEVPEMDMLTVFDGPPGEMASLVPDNADSAEAHFWTFSTEEPRKIWLECGYKGREERLIRPLPEDIVKCTQTEERKLSCE